MKTVNTHEAKTQLSKLLAEVAAGEEVIIAKAGKPVAKLTRYSDKDEIAASRRAAMGSMPELAPLADALDDPEFKAEVERMFYKFEDWP